MSELILWKEEEINKLKRDIDRLFDRCWSDFGVCRFLGEVSEGFSIKLTETEDNLVVSHYELLRKDGGSKKVDEYQTEVTIPLF